MGTAVISPRKIARYRRDTGLDIIAAYAPAHTHEKHLYLSDGRMAWLKLPNTVTIDDERWDASTMDIYAVKNYLAAYLEKASRRLPKPAPSP